MNHGGTLHIKIIEKYVVYHIFDITLFCLFSDSTIPSYGFIFFNCIKTKHLICRVECKEKADHLQVRCDHSQRPG